MNEPYLIMAAFGITKATKGAIWFLELVWEIAAAWDHGQEISVMKACETQWRLHHIHPKGYYGEIRDAIRPIVEASDEELAKLGIYPQKRTIPALAEAVSRWMISEPG